MSNRIRTSRGYVLLLVLLMLPLASVAMASVARITLSEALEASNRQDELQRKWVGVTVRQTLARQLPAILEASLPDHEPPPPTLHRTLDLGQVNLRIRLTDEQARVHVQRLLTNHNDDRIHTAALIQQLIDPRYGMVGIRIQPSDVHATPRTLRPELASRFTNNRELQLWSFGQLFTVDRLDPAWLVPESPDQPALMDQLTLWSDGRVNLFTAEAEAIRIACSPAIDERIVQNLLDLRDQFPNHSLDAILGRMELERSQRRFLGQALTDRSDVYGIWIRLELADRVETSALFIQVRNQTASRISQFKW